MKQFPRTILKTGVEALTPTVSVILQHAHPILGGIPGPLALATFGDVIWAAGGGRGFSAVFRFTEQTGWVKFSSKANGLRAVLPYSADQALIVGEHGFAAVINSLGEERQFRTGTNACFFALVKKKDGEFLTAGDDGEAFILRPGANLEAQKTTLGTRARIVQIDLGSERQFLVTSAGLQYGQKLIRPTAAPLTSIARSPDGLLAVTGDDNQLYVGTAPDTLEAFDTAQLGDIESVIWHDDAFLIGARGAIARVNVDTKNITVLHTTAPDERVTALINWNDGLLGSSWKEIGPPFSFKATLFFEGIKAPGLVVEAGRQNLPEPRTRTVALDVTDFVDTSEIISLDEAKSRLPRSWPDTQHEQVRYFAGNVRVKDTTELLADTDERGFAVVIAGHLIVDGFLDGAAGGDGYDSILVVDGDIWARSAHFQGGSTAVCRHLEVETAILCDHGDDGGSLWVEKVTAQVFSYETYFSKPNCPVDAFCIGDVYGEKSFPPERAREVFDASALDKGGWLDWSRAVKRLAACLPIVRAA